MVGDGSNTAATSVIDEHASGAIGDGLRRGAGRAASASANRSRRLRAALALITVTFGAGFAAARTPGLATAFFNEGLERMTAMRFATV